MFISSAPIVIIGMHRSGTTLLAQVLERSGICMGRDMIAYAESNFFQRCNLDLLKRNDTNWDKPVATHELPPLYNIREHFTRYASLRKHPAGWWPLLFKKKWGWKDPRNTFTLGSWLKLFPDLYAIHICRNGLDVARSLHERNAMGVSAEVADKTGPDACPFNLLYWDFLARHRDRFDANPRIGRIYATWDRMDPARRDTIRAGAAAFLARMETGEVI